MSHYDLLVVAPLKTKNLGSYVKKALGPFLSHEANNYTGKYDYYDVIKKLKWIEILPADFDCFAILTPIGRWFENSDHTPRSEKWDKKRTALLNVYKKHKAIIVDCHD